VQFPNFDPYIFGQTPPFELFGLHVPALGVRWYALSYILGIVLGWVYAARLLKNERIWGPRGAPMTTTQLDDLVLWITLGVIAGGRIGWVLFYRLWDQSMEPMKPLEVLQIWNGGMSFHGGLLGVVLAIVFFARANKIDMWRVGDLVAPCVPIGLFFGRIANFINGELWGRQTSGPFGIIFCNERIEETYQGACPAGYVARHPSQLYEAALEGLLLFALLRWATHRFGSLQRPGMTAGIFLLGYGVSRALLEQVREPDLGMPEFLRGWLTMGMLLSIPMIMLGAWLIWLRKTPEGTPTEAA
jgi:phosphatidylglycerol:prolipoprotein diacylglycerol transferase